MSREKRNRKNKTKTAKVLEFNLWTPIVEKSIYFKKTPNKAKSTTITGKSLVIRHARRVYYVRIGMHWARETAS